MNYLQVTPPCRLTILRNVGFILLSFFLLMWLSPDSFLMAYWKPRCDSAWFFTCGKAWMEGMTPYVDFADSKGPLLWLIYGIGYLLSPTSYIGVFWLSVLAYTFTFSILWRTARLFTGRREAAFVLVMLSVLLFIRQIHCEVRAEDFCMPWICAGIYCTTRSLQHPSDTELKKYAFWLGVSMAWCLLVKWNLFIMMGGMAIVVVIVALKRHCANTVAWGLVGIILPLLPFVAYLMAKGCFADMVREYFVNTFQITDNRSGMSMWLAFIVTNTTNLLTTLKTIGETTILVGIALFCKRMRFSWWLLLPFIPFFLFIELKAPWCYYAATTIPFFVYLLSAFTNIPSICSLLCRMPRPLYAALLSAIFFIGIAYNTHTNLLAFTAGEPPVEFTATEQILMRKPFCKIMFSNHEIGLGVRARALPACKYWALQNGAYEAMKEDRYQAIRERKPDFVITVSDRDDIRFIAQSNNPIFTILSESGYHQCQVRVVKDGKTILKPLPIYAKE